MTGPKYSVSEEFAPIHEWCSLLRIIPLRSNFLRRLVQWSRVFCNIPQWRGLLCKNVHCSSLLRFVEWRTM